MHYNVYKINAVVAAATGVTMRSQGGGGLKAILDRPVLDLYIV